MAKGLCSILIPLREQIVGFDIAVREGLNCGIAPREIVQIVGTVAARAFKRKIPERGSRPAEHDVGKRQSKIGIREIYTAVRWDSTDLLSFFKSIALVSSKVINSVIIVI